MGRQLFQILLWKVDRIERAQRGRELQAGEGRHFLFPCLERQGLEVSKLLGQFQPLSREFPIKRNDFLQQKRHERRWKLAEKRQVIDNQRAPQRRVRGELFGLELNGRPRQNNPRTKANLCGQVTSEMGLP